MMKREIEVLGFYNGHQLLDGQGEKIDFLKIIELAGRTCYKSFDKITGDSAKQFIHKLLKIYKHESVIEHSWLTLNIANDNNLILDILLLNNLFKINQRKNKEWLISGNIRMFRDLFKKISKFNDNDIQKYPIIILIPLILEYPDFFSDLEINKNFLTQEIADELANYIFLNPKIEYTPKEKLKHWWLAIRFKGGSRAFTHQLVRHRLCAISQESQRYCDEAGFYNNDYYVIPDSIKELSNVKLMDLIGDGSLENDLTLEEWYKSNLMLIDSQYRNLQNFLKLAKEKGLAKMKVNEDARFLLPNAVCSEIVISANLEEWRHIFKMRCDTHAQWEIRDFAMMVLKKAKSLFPAVFDDFIEENDEKSASIK